MHLIKLKIKKEFRCLKKNLEVSFNPITVLVGEQGSGKSSLLTLLRDNNKEYIELSLSEKILKEGIKSFYFDSESMNPRTSRMDDYSNPDGTSKGIGIGGFLMSKFKSHGEILREFTVNRIGDAKDCVLLLDEPEAALSLTNQYKLAKEILKCPERNVQIILATHCLPIIESIDKVFSMDTMKWVDSKKFIAKSQII